MSNEQRCSHWNHFSLFNEVWTERIIDGLSYHSDLYNRLWPHIQLVFLCKLLYIISLIKRYRVSEIHSINLTCLYANMVELADTLDLGSSIVRCESSNLFIRIRWDQPTNYRKIDRWRGGLCCMGSCYLVDSPYQTHKRNYRLGFISWVNILNEWYTR